MDSIFNQSFQDFEVIILDDASTDESRNIIEQYRHHPKIKTIIYNDSNSGSPFIQWEKGLALVETEWIWIAESDDYCDDHFLEAFIQAFKDERIVLAYSEIAWVNEAGQIIKKSIEQQQVLYDGPQFLRKKMLMADHLVNAGMVVFRTTAMLQVAPGWQTMKQAGDYWFWCEMARQGKVFACGKQLAYFTKHEHEISAKWMGTTTQLEEEASVLKQMKVRKILVNKDLRRRVIAELTTLRCRRKGMPEPVFNHYFSFWNAFKLNEQLSIHNSVLLLHEYSRKIKHVIRSKFYQQIEH